ncbi:hypothetical protein BC830DRAFT_1129747 [Chytriomyces sp. MP71]|nr:hypothetical protein BC830DRAFT_1129747 [Chytriomyces sp. MP71]
MRLPTFTQTLFIITATSFTWHSIEHVALDKVSLATQVVLFSSLAVFLSIYVYIAYYLPLVKGHRINFAHNKWRYEAPRLIQTATVSLLVLYISLSAVLSQEYSVFSFLIAGVELAGLFSITSLF